MTRTCKLNICTPANHAQLYSFEISTYNVHTEPFKTRCTRRKAVTKMNGFVRILSVAILVARVSGQICVEETLNCNDPVPTIFKLGDQSCACNNAAHAGALKYSNGNVYICLGSKWKAVQLIDTYTACRMTLDIPVKISWTNQGSSLVMKFTGFVFKVNE